MTLLDIFYLTKLFHFFVFLELMIASGLVLMPQVKWLSFHAGYDFGYLVNLLTCQDLPDTESDFFDLLKLYCQNIYDVK